MKTIDVIKMLWDWKQWKLDRDHTSTKQFQFISCNHCINLYKNNTCNVVYSPNGLIYLLIIMPLAKRIHRKIKQHGL